MEEICTGAMGQCCQMSFSYIIFYLLGMNTLCQLVLFLWFKNIIRVLLMKRTWVIICLSLLVDFPRRPRVNRVNTKFLRMEKKKSWAKIFLRVAIKSNALKNWLKCHFRNVLMLKSWDLREKYSNFEFPASFTNSSVLFSLC